VMILECPNCEARFRVPPEAVAPSGRHVRCGACAHVWQAFPDDADGPSSPDAAFSEMPPDDDADATAGPALEDELPATAGSSEAADDGETDASLKQEMAATMERLREQPAYAAAGVPALPQRRRPWILLGWLAWAIFMAGLITGLLMFRSGLQSAWPPSQKLYIVLGLEEPAPPPPPGPETALRVQFGSQPEWIALQNGWQMTVAGSVQNTVGRRMDLPPLTLELVDAEGKLLRAVTVELERSSLAAGEQLAFRRVIDQAPAETTGISYRWDDGA